MFSKAARIIPIGSTPEMLAEAAVLDGDEGVRHIGRKLAHVHRDALGQTALGDHPAAVVQDRDVARRTVDQEAADVRQVRHEMREEDSTENDAPRRHQRHGVRPGAPALCPLGRPRFSTAAFGDGGNAFARAPVVFGLLGRHTLTLEGAIFAPKG